MHTYTTAFEWTDKNRELLVENPVRIAGYVLAALLVRYVLHRLIDRATRRRLAGRRAQRARTIGSVLKSTVSIVLLTWAALAVLSVLGVNIAPFIASAGVVGLAVGFGAQNLVRDFVTGIFMLLEDQYGVGDFVDLGEASGEVESVGLRITTIRDLDGTLWYVRNGEIARVGNMSQEYAVARIEVPVALTADVDRAQQVALEASREAVADEQLAVDVIGEPEMLGVQEIAPDLLTLRITLTTRPNAQWAVARVLRREILRSFDEHGIDLPYPQGRLAAGVRGGT
ncbi:MULTISPECIES: mechanosensitive ion channel family protein [unclassified Gordonia (in: high G+C Gram-positive bacteria)]